MPENNQLQYTFSMSITDLDSISSEHENEQKEKQKIIEAVLSKEKDTNLKDFTTIYLNTINLRTLKTCHPEDWISFIEKRYKFFTQNFKEEYTLKLYVQKSATHGNKRILEYCCHDATYLLLTIKRLFRQLNLQITKVYHPVVHAEQHKNGKVKTIKKPSEKSQNTSLTYIEFEDVEDEDTLIKLEKRCHYHIQAVLINDVAQKDLQKILETVQKDLKKASFTKPDYQEECLHLIDWLKDENFSFFGYLPIQFSQKENTQTPLLEEGIGILSPKFSTKYKSLQETLISHSWQFRKDNTPLIFDRIQFESPLQRREKLMRLCIKVKTKTGHTEHNIVGILRQSSLTARNLETPLIHIKMRHIFKAKHILHNSYNYNTVIRIFTSIPKFELFRTPTTHLLQMVDDLLSITNPSNLYCFTQPKIGCRLPLIIVIPPKLFTHKTIETIETHIQKVIPHNNIELIEIQGEDYCRMHLYFDQNEESKWELNSNQLEEELRELIKPWEDQFLTAILAEWPGVLGKQLYQYYIKALPEHYRIRRTPSETVQDIIYLEKMAHSDNLQFNFVPFIFQDSILSGNASLLTIYNRKKIDLIHIMPIIENLGIHVYDELTTRIGTKEKNIGYIHSFRVSSEDKEKIDEAHFRPLLVNLLEHIFNKKTENDPINALMIKASLHHRAINCLITYRNYLQQISHFTIHKINQTLLKNPQIASELYTYFQYKFKPDPEFGKRNYRTSIKLPALQQKILDHLQAVEDITEDLIIRRLLNLLDATIRTNYYNKTEQTAIAIKLDSSKIENLPIPNPYREIYVHDTNFEGCHLRFGPVSRGGLRWSNRLDDFRTEILGLVKTQQTKNVVIIPEGSKGGFVIKHLPEDSQEFIQVGQKEYQKFITALLEISDTIDKNGQVIHPNDMIFYDTPDPYLVVAADKGTANFSDLANDVSQKSKFWLGDAFASGGSDGYNHKEVGITARGAWECVKLHFKELGKDIQKEPFSVIGIGDMSGDVFGNGMLLSKQIKLIAAFNHLHIFIDPDPDTEKSWNERERLFNLPSSTWMDYNKSLISKGGGIFNRKAKAINLTQEIRSLLKVKEKTLTGEQLITAILKAKVELLWFGGIGTYIKSKTETNLNVGDPNNDSVRVTSDQIHAKVIGEGANLGITQKARIHLSLQNIRINTDAIDNSAGVNMSDYEVNLKILLKRLIQKNEIKSQTDRNNLLQNMTEDVSQLCLANNRRQHRLITMDQMRSKEHYDTFIRFLQYLEKINLLDTISEDIPATAILEEMSLQNKPLPRPILAILQAYSKMWVYNELIQDPILNEKTLEQTYHNYFPEKITKKYKHHLCEHHLKKEILCTYIVNKMVNHAGSTFFYELSQHTAQNIGDIAKAYLIIDMALNHDTFRKTISLENTSEQTKYEALLHCETLIQKLTADLLQIPSLKIEFKLKEELEKIFNSLKSDFIKTHPEYGPTTEKWQLKGLSKESAKNMAYLTLLNTAIDIFYIHKTNNIDSNTVLKLSITLNSSLEFDWITQKLNTRKPHNHWEFSQRESLQQTLRFQRIKLFQHLLNTQKKEVLINSSSKELLEIIMNSFSSQLILYFKTIKQLKQERNPSLTGISVAINRLNFN